jgi:outer membrane lipopolysaccharide assembly protein LptE/RlpB
MKIIVLVLAILATSACSFKIQNCEAEPTVTKKEPSKTKDPKDNKTDTILDKIEEQVQPGAQITCNY